MEDALYLRAQSACEIHGAISEKQIPRLRLPPIRFANTGPQARFARDDIRIIILFNDLTGPHCRYGLYCHALLVAFRPCVRFLQILAGFVDRALGVVVGLHGQAVLVDGAVALAGEVEDLADGDVAPDLGPGRLVVAAKRVAEGVDRGLVVALGKQHLADAVAGQGADGVGSRAPSCIRPER